jgi:hypothetical protein
LKAGHGALVGQQRLAQDLEHHRLIEGDLLGTVDLPHAPFPDELLDPVFLGDDPPDVVVGFGRANDRAATGRAKLRDFTGVSAARGAFQGQNLRASRAQNLAWVE